MIKKIVNSKQFKYVMYMFLVIFVALVIQVITLNVFNQWNAIKSANILLDQVTAIMESNAEQEELLKEELKAEYIVKAQTAAYIIDGNRELIDDKEELKKIANLISVDEIHIFDTNGRLYAGTEPKYYGVDMGDGDQVAFFMPMLSDKNLTLCQDVTPNTAEGKNMMYAMTWNSTGEYLCQVGIEPVRLLESLKQSDAENVVNDMPTYEDISIYVVDSMTGRIVGSTDDTAVGIFRAVLELPNSNCVTSRAGRYEVIVEYNPLSNTNGYIIAILIELIYLVLAGNIIVGMYRRIRDDIEVEQGLIVKSNTDELTGLLNRRAYEDDLITYGGKVVENDFVYISMDVNGLKVVNDNLGHAAGDELLIGATECMKRCIGPYGRVYRTGGDEFTAIIFASEEDVETIKRDLNMTTAAWTGEFINGLSISCGFVAKRDVDTDSVYEIAKMADKKMYEDKSNFYRRKGVDRRGQQEAHTVLCSLYTKILKINITEDTYQIINMDTAEQKPELGFDKSLSVWLKGFGTSCQVHPDDLEGYLRETDLEYLREYFKKDKTSHSIFYRRKYSDAYKKVMMEIIPTRDYTDDNQTLFLYVKDIDK